MYLDNESTKKYYEIVSNANLRCPGDASRRVAKIAAGYVERHHIIPKSLGGVDDVNNLVWLTANEHLAVHLLLVSMVKGTESLRKMHSAAIRMCNPQSKTQQRVFDQIEYDEIRKECSRLHSEYMKGRTSGSKNPFFNRKHTDESKKLISMGGKGLKRTAQTRENLSKAKLGDKNPAVLEVTCPHCGKIGRAGGMRRHHFDHCKTK